MTATILLAALLSTASPAQAGPTDTATQLTATIPVNGNIALRRIHQALVQHLHQLEVPPLVDDPRPDLEPGTASTQPQIARANGNGVQ